MTDPGVYPFGDEITSTSNDREKFATYTRDSYTGLDYADQRSFASTYGRFNTPDQGKADPTDPSSINRYAYVGGDPISRADPHGTDWCDPFDPSDATYCQLSNPCVFSPAWGAVDDLFGTDVACDVNDSGGVAAAPDPAPAPTPAPSCGPVTTQLPTSGPGFYAYGNRANQYGQLAVVDDIEDIAAAWNVDNPNFDIGVGEISRSGGGPSGHQSHRTGDDVDIRPLTTTGAHVPTNINSPNYSATMTAELVSFIDNFVSPIPGISVKLIFFNGKPEIPGTTPYPGHNDHLHIRFSVSCTQ